MSAPMPIGRVLVVNVVCGMLMHQHAPCHAPVLKNCPLPPLCARLSAMDQRRPTVPVPVLLLRPSPPVSIGDKLGRSVWHQDDVLVPSHAVPKRNRWNTTAMCRPVHMHA
jgi:hypothetical protein